MRKISVREIKPEGLELKDKIDSSFIGLRDEDLLKFTGPIEVELAIEKVDSTVLAKTKVLGKFITICARCLEPIERTWNEKYYLDVPVTRSTEYIDLEENIRQEILLNLPTRLLCKEDCQGLCPDCGANFNKEKCRCKK